MQRDCSLHLTALKRKGLIEQLKREYMWNMIKLMFLQPWLNVYDSLKESEILKSLGIYFTFSLYFPFGILLFYTISWMFQYDTSEFNSFWDVIWEYYVLGWRYHLVFFSVFFIVYKFESQLNFCYLAFQREKMFIFVVWI